MEKNDDSPEDVKRATSVDREIKRGLRDDMFEGYPRMVEKKRRWAHCDKPPQKKAKPGEKSDGDCCEKQKRGGKKSAKFAMVSVFGEPCTLPKQDIVPRHCFTKREYIDMLATASRRCPPDCRKKMVLRKLRPVSQRIKELAQPSRQRMLITLQQGAAILPPSFLDNLVRTVEHETCLTPEQAATITRKKKAGGKKRKGKTEKWQHKETTKSRRSSPGVATSGSFDRDSITCQYLMAERFVRSILKWKCALPSSEFSDVAEVIVGRLVDVLEYSPPQDEDRKSQQLRFLADTIACWITGVLSEVAEHQKEKLIERCKKKEEQLRADQEEEEESDEDEDRDEDERKYDDEEEDLESDLEDARERVEAEEAGVEEESELEKEEEEEEEEEEVAVEVEADEDMQPEEEEEEEEEVTEVELAVEAETETQVEPEVQVDTEIQTEAAGQVEAETEAFFDAEAGPEPEPEPEEEAPLEAEVEAEADLGEEAEPDADLAEAEAEPEVEAEAEAEAVAEPETVADVAIPEAEAEPPEVEAEVEASPAEAEVKEEEEEEAEAPEVAEEPESREPEEEAEKAIEEPIEEIEAEVPPKEAEEEKERKETLRDADVAKGLEDLLKTDLPFLTFDKIIDTIYKMVEDASENPGDDPITNGIHRAIYEKLSTIVTLENPDLLTEELKSVMDVVCGKIATWLRSFLSESQIAFMERYMPAVESKEIRNWTRWLENISDAAKHWNVWLRSVIEKIFEMENESVTRGQWRDWTKSVDTKALLWRRFHLQTVEQAHRNLTNLLGRRVVKTGTKEAPVLPQESERLITATDLRASLT